MMATPGPLRRTILTAATMITAVSCATPPPDEPPPKLHQIRSAPPTFTPGPEAAAPRAVARIQRLDLPLNVPTGDAWALVNEAAFGAITGGVWNANGLRIGLMSHGQSDKFAEALPRPIATGQSRLFSSNHPMPIHRAARIRGPILVNRTVPPMAALRTLVRSGRLQLLGRLVRGRRNGILFDLIPHHHVPKLTLTPRDSLEKELDGRTFDELRVQVELVPNQILVIGLYRPWPQPTGDRPPETRSDRSPIVLANGRPAVRRPHSTGGTLALQDSPSEQGSPGTEPPPLANDLGRALLTASRYGQPIQTMLLIWAEPRAPIRADEPRP